MSNAEHWMIRVRPTEALVECRCGHLMPVGNLKHLALHHAEPTPAELEAAWRKAISYARHSE